MSESSDGPNEELQYHLQIGPNDVSDTVLLPGDPDRIDEIVSQWDHSEEVAYHREFRTVAGRLDAVPLTATSTGIGSPSAAIALEELAQCGVDTFIRVGSCGTIREDISVGDLVISTGAIRGEGTSEEYVRHDYPAASNYAVVSALIRAAEELGYEYHIGVTLSTDSFYPGQARPGFEDYIPPESMDLLDHLRDLDVINIEMETSAILTIASIYGLRAGAVCSVYANRRTGEFQTTGDDRSAAVANRAGVILHQMDAAVEDEGCENWYPGLTSGVLD